MSTFLRDLSLPAVAAGFLAVLISYAGPLAIVFQAGASAGIAQDMMTSWVWAISIGAAVSGIILSCWLKAPIVTAWSAPGAALLVPIFPGITVGEAVAGYLVAAAVTLVIGLSGSFDRLMHLIPRGVAAGMMAGILLQFGTNAFVAMETAPVLASGMVLTYLICRRLCPRYTLILLLLAGIMLTVTLQDTSFSNVDWSLTTPQLITPEWSLTTTLSLALPLVLVNLSGQFLPGMAILHGAGFRVSARPILSVTSLAALPMALFGGINIVVAAITAAICTGEEAHENPQRRYVAGVFNGIFYLLGGLFAGTIVGLFTSLPAAFITVLAGLALLGAIGGNLTTALEAPGEREAALLSFVVTASGLSLFGLSSAFWGVVLGILTHLVLTAAPASKRVRSLKRVPVSSDPES